MLASLTNATSIVQDETTARAIPRKRKLNKLLQVQSLSVSGSMVGLLKYDGIHKMSKSTCICRPITQLISRFVSSRPDVLLIDAFALCSILQKMPR
jgi:hypothetical protein